MGTVSLVSWVGKGCQCVPCMVGFIPMPSAHDLSCLVTMAVTSTMTVCVPSLCHGLPTLDSLFGGTISLTAHRVV